MAIGFLKRRKILKSVNSLDLIPIRLVEHEMDEQGKVKLLIPRFKNEILRQIFTGKRISSEFKISLDETGSQLWMLIDNEKTIEKIAHELKDKMGANPSQPDTFVERSVQFMTRLFEEDLITFKQLCDPRDAKGINPL
jgi:hypothetical protein